MSYKTLKNTNFWTKLKKPILALAPMAGVTDSPFRQMCKPFGADVVYSEMASASALFFNPEKTLELARFEESERPYIVQLFGNNPEHFSVAASIITEKIKPDGIDINFGCPAPKVFKQGSGCALMPEKELARNIISAVCDHTHLPVSIKIRLGIKDMTAEYFIKNIQDLLFRAVMIHGRTYEGNFSGTVDFERVASIKKMIPEKIVLANGGINTPEHAATILEQFPLLDGIGIARGALGKPFLFQQIKDILGRKKSHTYTFEEITRIALRHAEIVYRQRGDVGMMEMRKHLGWYFRGFPGVSELRKKLVQIESIDELKNILGIK